MINFTINVEKSEVLRTLLKDVASDYLTLFINKSFLYFVYKSPEIYIHRRFPILESNGMTQDDMHILRIDKKDFLQLVSDGGLTFTIDDAKVKIEYHNDAGGLDYTLCLGYQSDLYETYADYIELFECSAEYPEINLEGLGNILKVAKSLGTTLSISNDIASVNARGVFIFKEHKAPDFTINAKLLDILRRVSPKAYSVRNFVTVYNNELCVAITKTKHVETTEFDFVTKSKSSHKVTFKCNKILTLVKKLKLSEGRFLLDLDEKQAIFKTETKEFITDIEVGKILTAKSKKALEEEEFVFDFSSSVPATANIIKERVIPIIEIPPTILKGVLNNIGVNDSLTMYLKRNFVLLVVNGITVAFGKTKVG